MKFYQTIVISSTLVWTCLLVCSMTQEPDKVDGDVEIKKFDIDDSLIEWWNQFYSESDLWTVEKQRKLLDLNNKMLGESLRSTQIEFEKKLVDIENNHVIDCYWRPYENDIYTTGDDA